MRILDNFSIVLSNKQSYEIRKGFTNATGKHGHCNAAMLGQPYVFLGGQSSIPCNPGSIKFAVIDSELYLALQKVLKKGGGK